MADIAKLAVIIRMVFGQNATKEEFLTVLPLKGKKRGKDICTTLKNHAFDINLELQKRYL
jgi:hypothetical protein